MTLISPRKARNWASELLFMINLSLLLVFSSTACAVGHDDHQLTFTRFLCGD